jgi:hypothetical protein
VLCVRWAGNFGADSHGECGVPLFNRFHMPDNGNSVFWYGFGSHSLYTVVVSAEHSLEAGAPQRVWLQDQLAAVNRSSFPWLMLAIHRPVYQSEREANSSDYTVSEALQGLIGDLLQVWPACTTGEGVGRMERVGSRRVCPPPGACPRCCSVVVPAVARLWLPPGGGLFPCRRSTVWILWWRATTTLTSELAQVRAVGRTRGGRGGREHRAPVSRVLISGPWFFLGGHSCVLARACVCLPRPLQCTRGSAGAQWRPLALAFT